jgi:hypothetical protein
MHTFVKYLHNDKHEVWAVGYFVTLKTNGTQTFIPLFDVLTRTDAAVAVAALNGGGPIQGVNIEREYSEGIAPSAEIPTWKEEVP